MSNFHESENRDLVQIINRFLQILTICWALGEYIKSDIVDIDTDNACNYSIFEVFDDLFENQVANKYCDSLEITIYEIIKELKNKNVPKE